MSRAMMRDSFCRVVAFGVQRLVFTCQFADRDYSSPAGDRSQWKYTAK